MMLIHSVRFRDKYLQFDEKYRQIVTDELFDFIQFYNEKYVIRKVQYGTLIEKLNVLLKRMLDTHSVNYLDRQYQKHSSRYEKIIFDNEVYRVNYRTSQDGRFCYDLYCFIEMVKHASELGEDLIFNEN